MNKFNPAENFSYWLFYPEKATQCSALFYDTLAVVRVKHMQNSITFSMTTDNRKTTSVDFVHNCPYRDLGHYPPGHTICEPYAETSSLLIWPRGSYEGVSMFTLRILDVKMKSFAIGVTSGELQFNLPTVNIECEFLFK